MASSPLPEADPLDAGQGKPTVKGILAAEKMGKEKAQAAAAAEQRKAEIKKIYRQLAREFHPDHNQDKPGAEERFKEIQEAYHDLKARSSSR